MEQRASRIRRVRPGTDKTSPQKTRAKELLQLISNLEEEIGGLQYALKENLEELETVMKGGKLSEVSAGKAHAALVRPAGKTQNIIDVKKFFNAVEEDDFFSAVSVLVTKAKELLGQKELDKITRSIPGKLGDEKLKITYDK